MKKFFLLVSFFSIFSFSTFSQTETLTYTASGTWDGKTAQDDGCRMGIMTYPGIKSGERFFIAISTTHVEKRVKNKKGFPVYIKVRDPLATWKNFAKLSIKSRRLGPTAFSCKSGKRLRGFRPVFISERDWLEHKRKIDLINFSIGLSTDLFIKMFLKKKHLHIPVIGAQNPF